MVRKVTKKKVAKKKVAKKKTARKKVAKKKVAKKRTVKKKAVKRKATKKKAVKKAPAGSDKSYRLELFKGKDSEWYFRLVVKGDTLLVGMDGYHSNSNCRRACRRVIQARMEKGLRLNEKGTEYNIISSNGRKVARTVDSLADTRRTQAMLKAIGDSLNPGTPIVRV